MISVIVPAYNIAPYIERCVNSILNQTYSNLEILLVDDGSTDDTPAIVDRLAEKDCRIRVFHIENNGVSNARNTALDVAKGDYVSIIDGDDWIEETLYEDAINAMNENNVDCYMFEYFIDTPEGSNRHSCDKSIYGVISCEDLLTYSIAPQNRFSVTKVFKRSLVGNIRFNQNIILGEDTLFICDVLAKVNGAYYTDKAYYHYEQREGSAVRSNFNKKKLSGIEAYIGVLEQAKATGYERFIKESKIALVNLSIQLAKLIIKDSVYVDKKEDLKYIKSVVKKYSKGMNFNNVDKKTFVKILITKYCVNLLKLFK